MLITADRVITSTSSGTIADGAVLVDGTAIVAVGTRAEVAAQASADEQVLAFPGATVMPGLVDAHVHLVFNAGPDPVSDLESRDNDALLKDMGTRAQQLLSAGVTTVRDLGDRDHLALRLATSITAGTAVGPRIISAATPITSPGGHCWFLGGEASGVDEIRRLVQRNAAVGAKVIKVMETGGGLTKGGAKSWESQFAPEELSALVDEAHRAGLPVAAHAHGTRGIAAAVEAGVDTLEHCTWMTPSGFELQEDVLAQILDKGIHVCPTVSTHWQTLPKVFGPERAAAMFDIVRRMAEAGVRLIAGTDAGVQRSEFNGPAPSLTFYQHLGLTNSRIIEMATIEAARALGVADQTGQLAVGYSADLLVIGGDPLSDLRSLSSVRAVITAGVHHEPTGASQR
ncbi:amidohydrolase [Streptomyces coelicoflavus ZG0656]|nr:amidohydrolase [Streptomyces coelicoflavus ZG0656]MZE43547.1 amidohydrolase family protein [Streptomyces sp. SID5477]